MKLLFLAATIMFSTATFAQNPIQAVPGISYGAKIKTKKPVQVSELATKMGDNKEWKGTVVGEVLSVCEKKGCWMKLKTTNGDMMVKFKNYGFFMPLNIVGKTIVAEGVAKVTETPVSELKHYAEDAGKSKEEIEKITEPKKEITFEAKGVVVSK